MQIDYPERLAEPGLVRRHCSWRPWLLVGLVVLCFVPRAWLAYRLQVICPDGASYIQRAQALEQGNWRGGLRQFRLNPFIVAMCGLHHVGVEWESAGKWWNVVAASLVVLPLFGWVRRQFDDRVAITACVLYAVNAKLIQWSPEIIRDPTFWLLMVLSIYLLWRAIAEVRVVHFIAAGLVTGLATLTRFEGFYLVLPLAFWFFWRWLACREARIRLATGLVLGILAMPCLLVLLNFLWFNEDTIWRLVRTSPWRQVHIWLASLADGSPQAVGLVTTPLGQKLETFAITLGRAMTVIQGLLMLLGLWLGRLWTRRDCWPIACFAMLILAGMWIDMAWDAGSTTRYALPVLLWGLPFAALGLLATTEWFSGLASRFAFGRRWPRAAMVCPIVLVAAIGVAQGLRDRFEGREVDAELGRWARRELRVEPLVVGHASVGAVAAYYAGGRFRSVPFHVQPADIVELRSRSPTRCRHPFRRTTPNRARSRSPRPDEASGF